MTPLLPNQRPLIGLTGRRKKAGQIIGTPDILQDLDGDWYYADYARGVFEAGGLPVNLPLDVDPELFADRLDGILLSGGADIDAAHYGASNGDDDDPAEHERDGRRRERPAVARSHGGPRVPAARCTVLRQALRAAAR